MLIDKRVVQDKEDHYHRQLSKIARIDSNEIASSLSMLLKFRLMNTKYGGPTLKELNNG